MPKLRGSREALRHSQPLSRLQPASPFCPLLAAAVRQELRSVHRLAYDDSAVSRRAQPPNLLPGSRRGRLRSRAGGTSALWKVEAAGGIYSSGVSCGDVTSFARTGTRCVGGWPRCLPASRRSRSGASGLLMSTGRRVVSAPTRCEYATLSYHGGIAVGTGDSEAVVACRPVFYVSCAGVRLSL